METGPNNHVGLAKGNHSANDGIRLSRDCLPSRVLLPRVGPKWFHQCRATHVLHLKEAAHQLLQDSLGYQL